MLGPVLDLLAPPRCVGCGRRGALPWCPTCAAEARRLQPPRTCPRCAGACAGRGACPLGNSAVVATWAAHAYTGVVARTVVAGKVAGHHAVWSALGGHVAAAVGEGDHDLVVPVPTDRRRARRRGFDHTARLGAAVACALGVPCVRVLRVAAGTPDRGRRRTHAQLPAGAVSARRSVTGARILLVDDVLTTGATVRACAHALADAGAARIEVAVVARAGR